MNTLTDRQRVNAALKNVRTRGTQIKLNVPMMSVFTSSDVLEEHGFDLSENWAYARGRDGEYGVKFNRSGDLKFGRYGEGRKLYVKFSNPMAARNVADGFRSQGFEVEWDGSEKTAVVVTLG